METYASREEGEEGEDWGDNGDNGDKLYQFLLIAGDMTGLGDAMYRVSTLRLSPATFDKWY
jgi:hypothetical protein